jgi:hypothetical protein
LRKFLAKFRYYLALLFIITTISNVALLPNQHISSGGEYSIAGNDYGWGAETQ